MNSFDVVMIVVLGDVYLVYMDCVGVDKVVNMFGNLSCMCVLENMLVECKFGGGGLLVLVWDLVNMGGVLVRGEIFVFDVFLDVIDIEEGLFGIVAGYSEINDVYYVVYFGGFLGGCVYLLVFIEL